MSDGLSSLIPYPRNRKDELPPPRRDWGTALWIGFVLLLGGGLGGFLYLLAPGLWVLGLVAEVLPILIAGLTLCGLILFFVYVFAWQRSNRHDR